MKHRKLRLHRILLASVIAAWLVVLSVMVVRLEIRNRQLKNVMLMEGKLLLIIMQDHGYQKQDWGM